VRDLVKDDPAKLKIVDDYVGLKSNLDRQAQVLETVTAKRTEQLQAVVNRAAEQTHQPPVQVVAVDDAKMGGRDGYYQAGKLYVAKSKIQKGDPAELKELLYHEMTHAQQDNLMIRELADKAGVGTTASAEKIEEIKAAYKAQVAAEARFFPDVQLPEDQGEHIREVLKARNGERLNDVQSKHAQELMKAFREQTPPGEFHNELVKNIKVQDHELNVLAKPGGRSDLLRRISEDPELAIRLFGTKLPEDVQELLKKYPHGVGAETDPRTYPILQRRIAEKMHSDHSVARDLMQQYLEGPHEQEAFANGRRARESSTAAAHPAHPGDAAPSPAPRAADTTPPSTPRPADAAPPPAPRPGDTIPPPAPRPGDTIPPPAPRPGDTIPPPASRPGDDMPFRRPRENMAPPMVKPVDPTVAGDGLPASRPGAEPGSKKPPETVKPDTPEPPARRGAQPPPDGDGPPTLRPTELKPYGGDVEKPALRPTHPPDSGDLPTPRPVAADDTGPKTLKTPVLDPNVKPPESVEPVTLDAPTRRPPPQLPDGVEPVPPTLRKPPSQPDVGEVPKQDAPAPRPVPAGEPPFRVKVGPDDPLPPTVRVPDPPRPRPKEIPVVPKEPEQPVPKPQKPELPPGVDPIPPTKRSPELPKPEPSPLGGKGDDPPKHDPLKLLKELMRQPVRRPEFGKPLEEINKKAEEVLKGVPLPPIDPVPLLTPSKRPMIRPDGSPVIGPDGHPMSKRPMIGPDGNPMIDPDGTPVMGPEINPKIKIGPPKSGPLPESDPLLGPESGPLKGPESGPLKGPESGPLKGPESGPLKGPESGPLKGPDSGPLKGPDSGPLKGPDSGPLKGPDGGPLKGPDNGPKIEPEKPDEDFIDKIMRMLGEDDDDDA